MCTTSQIVPGYEGNFPARRKLNWKCRLSNSSATNFRFYSRLALTCMKTVWITIRLIWLQTFCYIDFQNTSADDCIRARMTLVLTIVKKIDFLHLPDPDLFWYNSSFRSINMYVWTFCPLWLFHDKTLWHTITRKQWHAFFFWRCVIQKVTIESWNGFSSFKAKGFASHSIN